MILVQLILYALVAFRLSELLVIDDGPFEIFTNIRGWFNKAPFNSIGLRRTIANALMCVHCVGLWISLLLGLVYYFSNPVTVTEALLFAFAVAGLQSIIAIQFGRTN